MLTWPCRLLQASVYFASCVWPGSPVYWFSPVATVLYQPKCFLTPISYTCNRWRGIWTFGFPSSEVMRFSFTPSRGQNGRSGETSRKFRTERRNIGGQKWWKGVRDNGRIDHWSQMKCRNIAANSEVKDQHYKHLYNLIKFYIYTNT